MGVIGRICDDCGGTGWLGHRTGEGQIAPDATVCPTCNGEGGVVPVSQLRGAVEALRRYGRHDDTCAWNDPSGHWPCDCGYVDALDTADGGR